MQNIHTTWNGWYSIITAIMMIGFLLVLTVSTFHLVLQELQDGKGRENYMKAYAGAEWALELALLKMKEKGYWYFEEKNDLEYFGPVKKNGTMSYDIDSETTAYTGALLAGEYGTDIIPLFIIDDTGASTWVETLNFTDLNNSGLVWNLVSQDSGLSGVWDFTASDSVGLRTLWVSDDFEFATVPISRLLSISKKNYLTVFNPTWNTVAYNVDVTGVGEKFTKPKTVIRSSSIVWKYSQNLDTVVDNSEFLGILKYSIYSWG